MNLALSGLHKLLEVFKDKTACKWDNNLYNIIGNLMTVTEWISANRPTRKEEQPK